MISLRFHKGPCVAGKTIEGRVAVNVAEAQKDHVKQVLIKFQGAIVTYEQRPCKSVSDHPLSALYKTPTQIVDSVLSLWTQGMEFPNTESHVVSCPFQFQLPDNAPPSSDCERNVHCGRIWYSLELVAERSGHFRSNRRIYRRIQVVPAASLVQLLVRESLAQGWGGPWKTITQEEKLRHRIWGDYSHARATLSIPDLPSFPYDTPIPFILYIVTETEPLRLSDLRLEKNGKAVFPAPPTRLSDVTLILHREVKIRVRGNGETCHFRDTIDLQTRNFGVPGAETITPPVRGVDPIVDEPQLISQDKEDRGIWRRGVHFDSILVLPFAPTFNTATLDWRYTIQLVVPFPGVGNDLKFPEFPIHLGPGSLGPEDSLG
ncbi:hypothetical protein B0H19DRAFT_948980 [Mycena capillaripes]|nr:hypothetical protein B0H19DRAFT_948980 [Mycena capillaripes]